MPKNARMSLADPRGRYISKSRSYLKIDGDPTGFFFWGGGGGAFRFLSIFTGRKDLFYSARPKIFIFIVRMREINY